jgi:hypothetical protein
MQDLSLFLFRFLKQRVANLRIPQLHSNNVDTSHYNTRKMYILYMTLTSHH